MTEDGRDCMPTRTPGLRWTPELIAYAVDLWYRRHLHVPTADEWEHAGDDHPSTKTVLRVFGSWNEAVLSAGLVPRKPGSNLRWQAGTHYATTKAEG